MPQRLILPPSGEAHGGRIDDGIIGEQSLDVLGEGVCGVDGIKPVCDIAQVRIELVWMNVSICNPWLRRPSWQYWHNRETAVPNAGMMGTLISQDGDTGQPTAQNEVLRQAKIPCYKVFCTMVGKVRIEFRQSAECQNLKRFPGRRKLWNVVFSKVLCDEIFLRTLNFTTDMYYIGLETCSIFTEIFVGKPEWAMFSSEIANHLAARGYLYLQNSMEDELLQLCVEVIDVNYISEMGIVSETMTFPVNLHRSPIVSQTEIARSVEDGYGFCLIINSKPPLFQSVNLLREGKGLLGIFHTEKAKSRPVALPKRGRVPGSIDCKGMDFIRNCQAFYRKSA